MELLVKAGKHISFYKGRIVVFFVAALLSSLVLSSVVCNVAFAQVGYRVLNETALTAKAPDHDLLEAITRAGTRVIAVGEHGIIITSDDDGRSWHQAAVPVDVPLTTVAFATPQEGWAGGALGVILHTTNGGLTWQIQLTGLQLNHLVGAAAEQFAASHPNDPAAERALRRARIFQQGGPDKPVLSIIAFDRDNVQAFGAYRICVKTKDGGKTWQDCSLDIPDPISHSLYDAVKSDSSIIVAGESGSVFRSNDNGLTFSQLPAPAGDTLFGALVAPDNALLSFGVAGGLFKSDDGGKTWVSQSIGTNSDITAGIVLESGTILLLTEAGTMYISKDNGKSFLALETNFGMSLFGAVQAANGDVLVVGTNGVRILPSDFVH